MKSFKICIKDVCVSFLVGIIFLLIFSTRYFDYVPIISEYDVLIKFLIVGGTAFVFYIRRHKIPLIFLWIIVFVVLQVFVTLCNHGYLILALWGNGLLILSGCACIQWGYEYNEKLLFKAGYYVFYGLVVINFTSMLLFPSGLYVDTRGISDTNFFLGNYNGFIIYMLCAIVFGYLYHRYYCRKGNLDYIILWILSFVTFSIKRSVTSIIVLLLLMIYMLFFNRDWTRMFLNIHTYVLGNIFIFFAFVWNTNTGWLVKTITGMLHKSITFTGRTEIWANAIGLIKNQWLFGHGAQSEEIMVQLLNNISAGHCHNLYLQILFQYGTIGLIIMIIILMISLRYLRYIRDSKTKGFLQCVIGVSMLHGQFEAGSRIIYFDFILLFLIYLIGRKNKLDNLKMESTITCKNEMIYDS